MVELKLWLQMVPNLESNFSVNNKFGNNLKEM